MTSARLGLLGDLLTATCVIVIKMPPVLAGGSRLYCKLMLNIVILFNTLGIYLISLGYCNWFSGSKPTKMPN